MLFLHHEPYIQKDDVIASAGYLVLLSPEQNQCYHIDCRFSDDRSQLVARARSVEIARAY